MCGAPEAADNWGAVMCECERRSDAGNDRGEPEDYLPELTAEDRGSATEGACEEIEPPAAPPNA